MQSELTLNDVLTDPMIAMLREADGISAAEFSQFLIAASQGVFNAVPARQSSPDFMRVGMMPMASEREPCLFC